MRLLWVELRDFRNHRSTELKVPDGLAVVVGPNGEGKTNLLEGMYYL
ncbi:MAG: AAA family ATPase, partial [Actinobacteria bacterium]|nr:AAA family ATPase [Actinomycetota bacterium]